MNLKDILVHIDERPTCTSRLETAIALATQQKSQLTGIYVIPHPHFVAHQHNRQEFAEQAKQNFKTATEAAGVASDWICIDSQKSGLNVPTALNIHAHYRDLLVISQTDEEAPDRAIPNNLPEKTILGSGRPVLVVPYVGQFKHEFKRILMAWRGGPESSRALHDAMPILKASRQIKVLTVQGREGDEAYQSHEADICKHMARYQLPLVCEKRLSGPLSVGDMLLNSCTDFSADLLVMGATEQSRRGYTTLGETGRHILKCMTAPVLMSH
ncbi:Nucleotide-binding universal stress protein, UspA family [Desulfuromusa kysingii]|uniref:Nucleotide-binding universal stress protein, UspA family n=1 Tax=Desulfuromusa kysingii TaxID=37625 RepID=A0A1H4CH72_9BACT|nr:universal stress protein [Desulfuromusa kysingii]SEA59669.1 Nucleotide-binding universal stress protein, UspA family [Desulfuromusa kysingii]